MNTRVAFHSDTTYPRRPSINRLLLGDYVRQAEIGAFGEERGTEQTLRFNAVVETALPAPGAEDDVDDILSYDTLIQTIDRVVRDERLDLLETLAERIAARMLDLPAVIHVTLRVEKLDRGPFSLGVEIERARAHVSLAPPERTDQEAAPVVVLVDEGALRASKPPDWLDVLLRSGAPVVLAPCDACAPSAPRPQQADRQIHLLAMDQAAWRIATQMTEGCVVDSMTELRHALDTGLPAIWAPSRMVRRAADPEIRDTSSGRALADWLAESLGGSEVRVLADEAEHAGEP